MSPDHEHEGQQTSLPKSGQDTAWIAGLRAGQFEVFQKIFEVYTASLIRFAIRTVPYSVAEELVQDVMFDVWQRRETITFHNGLTPYLFGSIRKKIISYLRHEGVVERTELDGFTRSIAMGESEAPPDMMAIDKNVHDVLIHALQRLSPIQQDILMLRWEHELSYEEIARTLSISLSAAKQHGSRAIRILRPVLTRLLG